MATGYKTIPNLDAASASQVEDDMLLEAAVIDLGSESGYASKRVTRGQLLAAMNDRVEVLEQGGKGVSNELKAALLQIASKVAYIDEHGQDYYDDLYDALYPTIHATGITLNKSGLSFNAIGLTEQLTATLIPAGATDEIVWTTSDDEVATVSSSGLVTSVDYGTATITATAGDVSATCSVVIAAATLVSISAVYSGGTVYDNISGLDDLKDDLVVTATWSDSTTTTLSDSDYTLSGSLNIGSNTITVTYGGQTDTFSVTVAEWLVSIAAVYTQSGIVYDNDSLNDLKPDLVVTATYADSTTGTITDYTLSGTLAEGTSTITVSYVGKTDTFTVTVTSSAISNPYLSSDMTLWLDGIYNTSTGHDSTATSWEDLIGSILFENHGITIDSDGMIFNGTAGNGFIGTMPSAPKTIEVVLSVSDPTVTQAVINGFGNASAGNVTVKGSSLLEKRGNYSSLGTNSQAMGTGVHTYSFVDGIGQYLDGESASVTSVNISMANSGSMTIGNALATGGGLATGSAGYPLTGKILCIRFYSDELTSTEIASNAAVDATRFNIS